MESLPSRFDPYATEVTELEKKSRLELLQARARKRKLLRSEFEEQKVKVLKEDAIAVTEPELTDEKNEQESKNEIDQVSQPTEDLQEISEKSGFTILEAVEEKRKSKVRRVLPHWLANPVAVAQDLKEQTELSEVKLLCQDLKAALLQNGITHLFPVQALIVPHLLSHSRFGVYTDSSGGRPNDVCVAAPTGSGKTLAFVLPIVQILKRCVGRAIRALAVLPTRDLATQVASVFKTYTKHANLKVALLTGEKWLEAEQELLICDRENGERSKVDIIVATPGRLVDHLNFTKRLDLTQLRFLVMDEADHLMREVQFNWLRKLEDAACGDGLSPKDGITSATTRRRRFMFQKLLFSATLLHNPERLNPLQLYLPRLYSAQRADDSVSDVLVPSAPSELQEKFVCCGISAERRPLYLIYLVTQLKLSPALCFCSTVEATHRLYHLLRLFGGVKVQELSSQSHMKQRASALKQLDSGHLDVLVCSDKLARGIDVPNVRYVISYEAPSSLEQHVHRSGRTARAGREGTCMTLLLTKQVNYYKEMLRSAERNPREILVSLTKLEPLVPRLQEILSQLNHVLEGERRKSS